MAVKIRLSRRGRKKLAIYDIVIADARAPRDGRFIEKIGSYNPNTDPSTVVLKNDRAIDWLLKGAQPTDTARSILSHEGIMLKKHLQVGVIKGAISQEQADAKFEDWKQGKDNRKQGAADTKSQQKAEAKQARLDAEKKVNETRAQAIAKKNVVEEPVAEAPAEEAASEEAPATEEGEAQA
ncbi:30S ribosomal protein S16 [Larkinella bovis]|uniref:Small ribosomal subunit protein bS16 n=1 Tax=Larkinella bovis TaxID=683041 RepID=A0ABW0I988_9BACT